MMKINAVNNDSQSINNFIQAYIQQWGDSSVMENILKNRIWMMAIPCYLQFLKHVQMHL